MTSRTMQIPNNQDIWKAVQDKCLEEIGWGLLLLLTGAVWLLASPVETVAPVPRRVIL